MNLYKVELDQGPPTADIDRVREANHRISNHLSLLVAMVQAQANAVSRGPQVLPREAAHAMLRETAGKIVSIGHLHRHLTEQSHRGDINLCDYLIEAGVTLVSSLSLRERVSLVQHLTANCTVSPEQAKQIGLMISEIMMNAIKHAHPTGVPVQIELGCRREENGRLTIEVSDDGIGLPEGTDASMVGGVGFNLIRSLSQSLKADLRIESDALGLTFLITLPATVHALGIAGTC